MPRKLVALFLTLACCLSLFSSCQNGGKLAPSPSPTQSTTPSLGEGQASPSFNLTSSDGKTVSFEPSKNPDKEVFLLVFWSYRFDPNVKTLVSRLGELHERLSPRGLNIIGISYQEEPAGLRKFLDENPLPFDVAVGSDATYGKFAIESIPTLIVVDRQGKIAERLSGYYSTEELSELLSPYLPGRSGNSEP